MKKILLIVLVSALALIVSTGCDSKSDSKVSQKALYVDTQDNKKILHAIEKAGEKTGWEITKFKGNEVIAEKTSNGHTVSLFVKFADGHIEFEDNEVTSDLRNAIEDELSKDFSSH